MTPEQRRALLELVAAGDCTPEEAAALLAEPDDSPAAEEPGAEAEVEIDIEVPEPDPAEDTVDDRVRVVTKTLGATMRTVGSVIERELHASSDDRSDRVSAPVSDGFGAIRVHVSAGKARIIGDTTIEGVSVDGPHRLHQEGDTMVVDCEGLRSLLADLDIDVARTGSSRFSKSFVITGGPGSRGRRPTPSTTTVRVNPALPITIEVAAGSAAATDLRGPVVARVDAGSLRLEEASGPLDVEVHAGSFTGRTRLTAGDHRVVCEAGSVTLDLDERSDVRVAVVTELGSTNLDVPVEPVRDGKAQVFTVGDGSGSLDIVTTMGSCRVRVVESVRS